MASEKSESAGQSEHAFDFISFLRKYREKELLEKDIKPFVHAITTGVVNDLQLCAWLCSVHEKPLKFSELFYQFYTLSWTCMYDRVHVITLNIRLLET